MLGQPCRAQSSLVRCCGPPTPRPAEKGSPSPSEGRASGATAPNLCSVAGPARAPAAPQADPEARAQHPAPEPAQGLRCGPLLGPRSGHCRAASVSAITIVCVMVHAACYA